MLSDLPDARVLLASSPGSRQGAEQNEAREPGIHCTQLVLYPWNSGDSIYSQYSLRVMNVSWRKLHVKREYGGYCYTAPSRGVVWRLHRLFASEVRSAKA